MIPLIFHQPLKRSHSPFHNSEYQELFIYELDINFNDILKKLKITFGSNDYIPYFLI